MATFENLQEEQVAIHCANCLDWLRARVDKTCDFGLTFLDPPFNQGKEYREHDDSMSDTEYWTFMRNVCSEIHDHTIDGGSIYFMQREKNTEDVLRTLRETGWTFQNLIIWKKLTSAIPSKIRYGKSFQIIAFATKGLRPAIFNKLRIQPKLPAGYRPQSNGVFVTDVWSDIRELTSGYYASDEALRDQNNERRHKQQSPISLLLRILLSSSQNGTHVFDPFAGTGTTAIVASQLKRHSTILEIDPINYSTIIDRLKENRISDSISKMRNDYVHTEKLDEIWQASDCDDNNSGTIESELNQQQLFSSQLVSQ